MHMTNDAIIVVSGLPRSGTSLMMKMLAAGGVPILTDGLRTADIDNPEGYYEFERVKSLDKDVDSTWLADATGCAIKIITALLVHLPPDYNYRVILMQRNLQEVLTSQEKMLRNQKSQEGAPTSVQLAALYTKHLQNVTKWLNQQPHFEMMEVNYNHLIRNDTDAPLQAISQFLRISLDVGKMQAVINPSLYRNRIHG